MKGERGFTLLEVVLALMIIAALSVGQMIPIAMGIIEDTDKVNARLTLERIKGAILNFYNDEGFFPKYVDGKKAPGGETYNILRSQQGDIPSSLDPKWLETTKTDFIENQLVTNQPGYKERIGAPPSHGWNGPYLSDVLPPDPWGNKWFVNVEFLDETGKPMEKHRVWILSAGPNEVIDTTYSQLQTTGQLGGDDIGLAIIHK
jgi:prepilin-type N-terminal cleavage/methylation domain-containing protein